LFEIKFVSRGELIQTDLLQRPQDESGAPPDHPWLHQLGHFDISPDAPQQFVLSIRVDTYGVRDADVGVDVDTPRDIACGKPKNIQITSDFGPIIRLARFFGYVSPS
jgi:hypothetical protein